VLLFELGFGDALNVPTNFSTFHDSELIEDKEAALAYSVFQQWLSKGSPAPRRDQCVGYRIPLFLGGKDDLENLEVTDMEVYWAITGQLLAQTSGLGLGTPIKGLSIE